MKKWTATSASSRSDAMAVADVIASQQPLYSSGIALHRVLQFRRPRPLNEIEVWALLAQAGSALRDRLREPNSRVPITICPRSVICTASGKVALVKSAVDADSYYLHPTLSLATRELIQRELEAVGVFSLARTAERCLLSEDQRTSQEQPSDILRSVLSKMQLLDAEKALKLNSMLETASEHWRLTVGATPTSRFISQMCRMALSWQQSSVPALRRNIPRQSSNSSTKTVSVVDVEKNSGAEVEFSRLETSSSSSCSAEDEENNGSSTATAMTEQDNRLASPFAASMPNLNNNMEKGEQIQLPPPRPLPYHQGRGQYGRRLAYQPPSKDSTKTYENIVYRTNLNRGTRLSAAAQIKRTPGSAAVKRNPSRLYRVVKPLTEVTPTPSPATKRCIGPEFVVMNENSPVLIDLHINSRNVMSRQVEVIMLNGQKILVRCNPMTITAGEVLDNVLSYQDIRETAYFALAVRKDEYWCLASDAKLGKVAPVGWKQPQRQFPAVDSIFTVYLRFRHHPDDVDEFRDPNNKHLFYLQLRRDIVEGRFHMSATQHLSLAAKALQTEFGDFSEDIHGEGEYFLLQHYLPAEVIRQMGETNALRSLTRLHRAHLGQSLSKTEIKYCKEVQRLDNYGFHIFAVQESKKPSQAAGSANNSRKKHIGIHLQGVFLFETSQDRNSSHKMLGSFFWHSISRIQYDKSRFQLSVQQKGDVAARKVKFYVSEVKAKVMFDLASAHHKYYMQNRWKAGAGNNTESEASASTGSEETEQQQRSAVEYREPKMRSLKNRLLSKNKQSASQRRLYTKAVTSATGGGSLSSKRAASSAKLMVKRLTHYASMADAANGGEQHQQQPDVRLNDSEKENQTPNTRMQSYRYKFYLEPEVDDHPESAEVTERKPLQERTLAAKSMENLAAPSSSAATTPPPPPPPRRRTGTATITTTARRSNSRRRISTLPVHHRRRSEQHGVARKSGLTGVAAASGTPGGDHVRMGTRISLSALHRERLRLTTEMCLNGQQQHQQTAMPKKLTSMDLDYDTMETKSLFHLSAPPVAAVIPPPCSAADDDCAASLSESLIERFDNMEAEETEPERKIVSVTLARDPIDGRLGLKISGTPSGVYVDTLDDDAKVVEGGRLQRGDRLVAINGRSLENVNYSGVLELIRKSAVTVQFLVSQISSS